MTSPQSSLRSFCDFDRRIVASVLTSLTSPCPMSFVGRIIAGARDLSFGGPLGASAGTRGTSHSELASARRRREPRWRPAPPRRLHDCGDRARRQDGDGPTARLPATRSPPFGEVFQVPPGEEEHVRLVFDLARKSTAGFESYARQVGRLFADDRAVLEDLARRPVPHRSRRRPRLPGRGCLSARSRSAFRLRRGGLCPHPRAPCRRGRARERRSARYPRGRAGTPLSARSAKPTTVWCVRAIPTSSSRKACRPNALPWRPRGWRASTPPMTGWQRAGLPPA